MNKKTKIARNITALLLAFIFVFQTFPKFTSAFAEEGNTENTNNADGQSVMAEETKQETPTPVIYEDGVIFIYNEEQLRLIGSDKNVTVNDFDANLIGNGENITDGDLNVLYSNSAKYKIVNTMVLHDWSWPEGFKGQFVGAEEAENRSVYNADEDAIYIYHPYQLKTMSMENRDIQTVLSGDAYQNTFGTGSPVTDKVGNPVTYSDSHTYIISNEFAYKYVPLMKAPKRGVAAYDGRDFKGQVTKVIDGKTYILIGNEAQLRAIGSDKDVFSAVYQTKLTGTHYVVETDQNGEPIMLYGGDADLLASQNGYKDFNFQAIDDKRGGIDVGLVYYAGVDQSTGEPFDSAAGTSLNQTVTTGNAWKTGQKYSIGSNYIIFRDIDLEGRQWTPLMFNGIMYGAKGSTLWDGEAIDDATEINTSGRPVISNVFVNQTDAIDVASYEGVGFFATITNKTNTGNIGLTGDRAEVHNIELANVDVRNQTTETQVNQTVVNALTSGLGIGAGWLLDQLLKVLSVGSVQTDLQHTLSNLLNARAEDPSVKATGAFAGRLVGDALIENCAVTGSVKVSSVNDKTGGFIGYSIGTTEYSGLSQALGAVAGGLTTVLNLVPVLGLGDLVTILLGNNTLPLGQLIPTGYKAPTINSCEVSGLMNTIGAMDTEFNGGFIGHQIGTKINDSIVRNSTFTVNAKNYGGGFCGNMRDAEIKGTLDGVGVDLSEAILTALRDAEANIHPQSVTQRSQIKDCIYTVQGGNMLGGFVGVQNSGVLVDDTIDCSENDLIVSAMGNRAGGFSGYATVGWLSSLGEDENNENSLLGTVRQLATSLLSTDQSAGQRLLSLMGLAPSTLLGCQIHSNTVNVISADNFAGGLLGKGDGVYIGSSSEEGFTKINNWDGENLGVVASNIPVVIENLESVTAENYAGGVVGYDGSAAFQGLLNGVAGLGDFIGFDAKDVTVNGVENGYVVTATNYNAGGAFGLAVGGNAQNIVLNNLKRVEAINRAAGFVGVAGPGELLGTSALTVNLLGLDRLLAVQNLLSAGQGVEVHIDDCIVNGIDDGFTVEALGGESDVYEYTAAGFIADSNSTKITNSHTYNLLSVKSPNEYGYSGGFVGTSETGGLAEVANNDDTSVKRLIEANGLIRAIGYLIPSYTNCTVHFVSGQGYVEGDIAGGFVADMESGTVDNQNRGSGDYYSVYDINEVKGQTFGGGFGGKVVSGALANAGGGLSILGRTDASLNVSDLLTVIEAYVPYVKYAGVKSDNGFTVTANRILTTAGNLNTGAAGGFIGYASGAQISYSDVSKLKHTNVTPPEDLESVLAPSYFSNDSEYAVTGGRHAGGYIGNMDIGSAASLGSGLKVLKDLLNVTGVVSALSVVVSTVEHSCVEGKPGGFTVIATGNDQYGLVGKAGGFAGEISGGHVQDSHAKNFSYIIGQEYAGGFVGNFRPGDVARLLDDLSAENNESVLSRLLSNIADVNGNLLSLIQSFIPTIRNSTTTCIPCGGAVRADAASDAGHQRGVAGGFCGHNEGGSIWGNDDHTWQTENDGTGRIFGRQTDNTSIGSYTGPQSECKAERIHSVYGFEYAGGFTGYMEPASTANTGNIKLLGGLITANNLLSALNVVYPTEENTAVYGPLRGVDIPTWNAWVEYVGKTGAYAFEFANAEPVTTQEELDEQISKYVYGTNVVAGREYDAKRNNVVIITEGGNAGGYAGYMVSGTITNGQAYDTKLVKAMRSAGGFVGKMKSGGAAEFGNVNLLGLELEVGSLVRAAQVFVPVIKNSSVQGFQSGLKVYSPSDDFVYGCGNAGGYAGAVYGGQIWGDENETLGCDVKNLRYVQGKNAVGGYIGLASAASVADVNTNAGTGFLQGVLNTLLTKTNGDLASVLEATVTTVRNAHVSASENNWGYVVEGVGSITPRYAGGFAGYLEASVIGDREGNSNVSVSDLRSVDGKYYAGGFIGLADVGGVASVSAEDNNEQETSVLDLIKLGNTSVLDIFRTYIYFADVNGVPEGIIVRAHSSDNLSMLFEERFSGSAGGFGGGIMDGTVQNSNVTNLNTVLGINYTGGFVGHLGKSGAADVDDAQVSNLLGLTAGVLNVFGSHIDSCTVSGIPQGMVVKSMNNGEAGEQITGGFVGFADCSRIKNSEVLDLKQVKSDEIAGGFAGKTDMQYLVEAGIDSELVRLVLDVVNGLLNILYVEDLEHLGLIDLDDIPGLDRISNVLGLELLADGNLLYVNLLGLRIGVSLVRDTGGNGQDTAIITIGDSTISLPASKENGVDSEGRDEEIMISLFKANHTKIDASKVTGIDIGYDVYGGGASNDQDGISPKGFSGGFIGRNHEGELSNNEMIYCDVVRGTEGLTSHFTGTSDLQSVYSFNTMDSIEGENNVYHVYRETDKTTAEDKNGVLIANAVSDTGTNITYNRFDVTHRAAPIVEFIDWKDATMGGDTDIDVYVSPAKAVLMRDTPTKDNGETMIPEPNIVNDPCDDEIDYTVQKIWNDIHDFDGIRPDSITIILYQSEVLADGTVISDPTEYDRITMSKEEDGRFMSATWTHVIEGLPVAYITTDPTTNEEIMVYYRYTADEVDIDGYQKSFEYDERGMITTITNTHTRMLPFTGGRGAYIIFYAILLIITAYVVLTRTKQNEETERLRAEATAAVFQKM